MHSNQILAQARTQWESMPSQQEGLQATKEGESTTGQQDLGCFMVRRGLARFGNDLGVSFNWGRFLAITITPMPGSHLLPSEWRSRKRVDPPSGSDSVSRDCGEGTQWHSNGYCLVMSACGPNSLLPVMQPQTRNGFCIFQWLGEKNNQKKIHINYFNFIL